jgi:hypothetical protein
VVRHKDLFGTEGRRDLVRLRADRNVGEINDGFGLKPMQAEPPTAASPSRSWWG